MDRERYEQRKTEYGNALKRLKEALAQPENEYMRDAVIQRFEFTYEMAWKAMKQWLEGKDITTLNAKDTLTEALAQNLISDGNGWSALHRNRNLTSHTYQEDTAKEVYAFVKNEGVRLFEALEKTLSHV
jgi:nucleotidyltransferase substrate binding protein (TIGR01987 family)